MIYANCVWKYYTPQHLVWQVPIGATQYFALTLLRIGYTILVQR
jgi:hypothetical protein